MVDIEAALIAWLPDKTGIPWHGDVPEDRPEQFGTVERTGGGISDVVIDSPTVALQLWGKSRSDAKNLAYKARDALPAFAYEPGVRKVEVETLYNFPDEKGNQARYQIIAHFKTV